MHSKVIADTHRLSINPLIPTLKQQSNGHGPLYSNTVIGTLAVDGWAVTFGTASRELGGAAARPGPYSLNIMRQLSSPINDQCTNHRIAV